jgi:protein tyrosine phosphatase (PTP) superfamily phosphohydrolase (DUF442 family)
MPSDGLQDIQNFLRISERVGTAGQPTQEQFAAVQAAGYEIVVNLDVPSPEDVPWSEADIVSQRGMKYIHIPVVWGSPQPADLDRFFEVMDHHEGKKLFVHCAANYRVSAFMFLHRVIRCGTPIEEAQASVRSVWEPNDVWHRFIEESLSRHGISATFCSAGCA